MANLNITINGTEFENINSYSLTFEDIKNTTQTANGATVMSHVATKAKITVGWHMLKNDELKNIVVKINNTAFNTVGYYDYAEGDYITGDFYVDSRSAAIAHFDEAGQPVWEEFTLAFAEK